MLPTTDTICAVATPAGRGGVSIVRVSGPKTSAIAKRVLGFAPRPRHAHYGSFLDAEGETLDFGIGLYFPAPHSLTGEDVLELQSHGGPVLVDRLIEEVRRFGARLARPGEFSERAFLNEKMDLAQLEAVADLIESSSREAARSALRSLQGEFSDKIHDLVSSITGLRVYVEAAIDFPEEEVDFLESGQVLERLDKIRGQLQAVFRQARQGSILREGLKVVIAGEPNAGKSSLLNRLSGQDSAIVTDIPGTTRDTLREHITIDGMPLHVIDTAGLRSSADPVEQEGIRRAWKEIRAADRILLLIDATDPRPLEQNELWRQFQHELPNLEHLTLVRNKIDLTDEKPGLETLQTNGPAVLRISARGGEGLEDLRDHLKQCAGYRATEEGGFIARRRHLDALTRASAFLDAAREQLTTQRAGELVAEDLREAQNALSEITGAFTSDDLLGEIFSSFCIGK